MLIFQMAQMARSTLATVPPLVSQKCAFGAQSVPVAEIDAGRGALHMSVKEWTEAARAFMDSARAYELLFSPQHHRCVHGRKQVRSCVDCDTGVEMWSDE